VNAIINLPVPYKAGKFSSDCTTGGLSSSAQLHRVSYMKQWLSAQQCQRVTIHEV
jgi:hypothetical protein